MSTREISITALEPYQGLPGSAHGGYFAGLLIEHIGDVVVTLLEPIPLGKSLTVEPHAGRDHVYSGNDLIATATHRMPPIHDVPPVGEAVARAAELRFAGHAAHPYPGCFVCGTCPERTLSLDLTPGPVDSDTTYACTWMPTLAVAGADGRVKPALVCAALDCPGGWALDPNVRPMVLSTFAARLGTVRIGNTYVIVTDVKKRQDRMAQVNTSMYGCDLAWVGSARATWLAL